MGSLWELRESSPVRYVILMTVVVTAEVAEEVTQGHNSLFGIQNPNLCNAFGWRVFAAFGGPSERVNSRFTKDTGRGFVRGCCP